MIENQLISTLVVCVGGSMLIAARRYNNRYSGAGAFIAFGIIVILCKIWGV